MMAPGLNTMFLQSTYLIIVCFLTTAMCIKGRNFYFGLMEIYEEHCGAYLLITSDQPATVTVAAPLIQMRSIYQTKNGYLRANLFSMFQNTVGYGNKGISVHADVDISVYVVCDCPYAPDSIMVIPVPYLGKRHIVGMFPSGNSELDSSEILIVAGNKDTSIQIILRPSVPVILDGKNYKYGDVYSLELSEYETYFLKTIYDLTGTEILSNKPISVFSGNKCVSGKYRGTCDHIVEQIPSVDSLGTNFIVLPFNSVALTIITTVRLVAAYDNTEVHIQGERKSVLNTGKYLEYECSNLTYINASNPILLLEMGEIKGFGNPFMVVLPSISQFSTEYTFSLPISESGLNHFNEHHVVVTVESEHQHGILLDGVNATADFSYYVTDPDILTNVSVLVYEISSPGLHRLQHLSPDVKFGAVLYGTSNSMSYGHPLGMNIHSTDCASAPCQNGGTCEDLLNDFWCTCPHGFYGDLCDTGDGICQPQPADMIFLLDSSVSQTEENFRKQLDFVSNFTDHVLIGPNDTQVSLITFSSEAHVEFGLDTHQNCTTLKAAIQNVQFKPGTTRTDKALQKAKTLAYDARSRKRPIEKRARIFVFVLTDGMSTYRHQTKRDADILKGYVEAVAAVGIGKQVSHQELRDIASTHHAGDSSYVFSVENFDSLYTIVTELIHITCEECSRSAMSDVLLMIDDQVNTTSNSIKGFSGLLDSVYTLVGLMDTVGDGDNDTHVSLASFSDSVRTYVNLSDRVTKDKLRNKINTILHKENAVINITSAFQYVNEHGFDIETGGRSNATKFLVLFTNGGYNLDIYFQKERDTILKKGVTIITVGMEPEVNILDLLQIASGPYHVIVHTNNLDVLKREFVYNKCQLNFDD